MNYMRAMFEKKTYSVVYTYSFKKIPVYVVLYYILRGNVKQIIYMYIL